MNICELCRCSPDQTCALCKVLAVVGLVGLSVLLGYLIGRRKNK